MKGFDLKKHLPKIFFAFLIFYTGNRISFIYRNVPVEGNTTRILQTMRYLQPNFLGLPSIHSQDLIVGLILAALIFMIVTIKAEENKGNFRKDEEYGSARWGNKKDIAPFLSKNKRNRILLSQSESIMINEQPKNPKHQRNNNVLVVGGSGSGKTRFFVKPNLMQMNSSYVVTDSKGDLVKDTGKMFEEAGYKIKVVDTIDLSRSMHYNPFEYIKSEADILKFVDVFIANTTSQNTTNNDEFWVNSEKLYYMALIGLMFEMGFPEERNFKTLVRLVNASSVDENDSNYKSPVDMLFDELEAEKPDCFAVSQYKKFKLGAGKTLKSILISCGVRLAPFDISELREMTEYDELELETIGDEKTILYLTVSDNVTTFNFILGILYSQLFNILLEKADNNPGSRLNVPVQFYLDEFANIGKIPNFERMIAIIRSRGISAVIVLQALSQLKSTYKDHTDTIIGNCDSFVFLGGKESETLKSLSAELGKETIDYSTMNRSSGHSESYSHNRSIAGRELMTADEIARLDNSECIVSIRGVHPFKSKKYDITKHPYYNKLHNDSNDDRLFSYEDYLSSNRNTEETFSNELKLEDLELTALDTEGQPETYTFDPDTINQDTELINLAEIF